MNPRETLVWLLYDIGDNRCRTRVAKACLEAGLHRVQKSVFLGIIERNALDELALRIEDLIDESADSVYVFPLCERDFRKVRTMGMAFDRRLVSGEVKAFFV